jgi:CRP/FNR family transcriptional regulator, nitrogen oxide reductase regulator
MSRADQAKPHSQLQQVSLFRGIGPEGLEAIAELAREPEARRDAYFFHQGDPANILYILKRGQVKLTQLTPEGSQVLMSFVGPGEMFGGIGVLGDLAYAASAQAAQDSVALTWDGATITRLMESYPPLALNAMRHLAQRVQELQQRNLELATERVERRVARALLRLAAASGRKVEGGVLIDLPLSRQDVAEMTGTTLYTVSRILSAWQEKGIVEAGREKVLIHFPHGLVVIAEDLPRD